MYRVALLLFLSFALPARANLGETVEQCVARYGRPIGYTEAGAKFPFGTVAFSAGGYTLIVFVAKDKEVGARVSKLDKTAFTDAEVQTILAADTSGSAWTEKPASDPLTLTWDRADHATAYYDKDKRFLVFTSAGAVAMLSRAPSKPPPAPAQP